MTEFRRIELTKEEWETVLFAMQHAAAVPGFKTKYNPLPWVLTFQKALKKIEAALNDRA